MKKFIALAIVCSCAASLFAGEIEIKNIARKNKIGDKKIVNWQLNGNAKNPSYGTCEVIQGSEKDEKAVKIANAKIATAFYYLPGVSAKAGSKVKISADVKGKGTFLTGFYTYTGKVGYFPAVNAEKSVTLTDKFQEVEFEFIVSNGAKGQICETIRPFIKAGANSEVIIEDLEIEIEPAK